MANRRMFSLDVVDTDKFLEMPATSQNLYFHLGMRADDDGFVAAPKKIAKSVNCGMDDLNILVARGFLIAFDDGVVVVTHWKQNNYVRPDRYKETIYQDDKALLTENNGIYSLNADGIPMVYQNPTNGIPSDIPMVDNLDTQVRLGKDSIGKGRKEEKRTTEPGAVPEPSPSTVADMFNEICTSYPKVKSLSDKRMKTIKARLKRYTLDDFKTEFEKAEASDFLKGRNNRDWSATFDWLIADANMAKVLDGNYDNREGDKDDGDDESGRPASDFYRRYLDPDWDDNSS